MNKAFQDLIEKTLKEIDPDVEVEFTKKTPGNPVQDIEISKVGKGPLAESVEGSINFHDLVEDTFNESLVRLVDRLNLKIRTSGGD